MVLNPSNGKGFRTFTKTIISEEKIVLAVGHFYEEVGLVWLLTQDFWFLSSELQLFQLNNCVLFWPPKRVYLDKFYIACSNQ